MLRNLIEQESGERGGRKRKGEEWILRWKVRGEEGQEVEGQVKGSGMGQREDNEGERD